MRGSLNRDGKIFSGSSLEQTWAHSAAFAQFDFRPAQSQAARAALQPPANHLVIVTPDEAGDGIGLAPGNPTLTVDADSTIGTLGIIGDQDFYQVTLVAGHVYEFGMFGHSGGPNLIPVQDAYIELYNASGTLLGSADGGASTLINNVNSGFDAVLTFTATTSGTYYVNARAFDNDPTDGTNGEGIGDYEVYAAEIDPNDPNFYQPYYDAQSPLYAIDWGTQVNRINQSARNPDGNEGTRDTGNAQGTPVIGDPTGIAALAAAQNVDITGKNVITIYFANAGDVFTSNDPTSPGLPPVLISAGTQDWEKAVVMTALHEFEKVADVVYVVVPTREQADFFFTTYAGTPGPGVSLLGSMSPPDESDEGLAQFNSGDYRWTEENLQQGGFSYVTLIHEFGHGHGLAHPHDNGGHSGIMNGVESEGVVADYTLGDYELNQAVYTMMSYEDGWQTSPYGNADTDVGYGYLGGLMAFDIAAIQDKYGVNENWATGNDAYVLKDVNAAGTFYSSIWDGGGTDSISYNGARDAHIDLRPASLEYEYGGGGWISYADGIYGGFTIANGVTIENAYGGSGADTLIGNDAANSLLGRGGLDVMIGGKGNDAYFIDDLAGDRVVELFGEGNDTVYTAVSFVLTDDAYVETLSTNNHAGTTAINLTGNHLNNTIVGNQGANVLHGRGGVDQLIGFGGNDVYYTDVAATTAWEALGGGNDALYTSVSYALQSGSEIETLSTNNHAATAAINLTGNHLNNTIVGNAGVNVLHGGGGTDVLIGFGGNDVYYTDVAATTAYEAVGAGYDALYSSVSYTLASGSEIETLSTNSHGATASINLTGNAFTNDIYGNAGANILDGKGGADYLTGFGGADTFAFTTALGGGNVDTIFGFSTVDDTIALDDAVFTGIGGVGALNANAFNTGTGAADASDRIIYNSNSGALYFDADGNGAGAAVQFATIGTGLALTASDFSVI